MPPPVLTVLESEPAGTGIIELLEGLLERANNRELSSLAYAIVLRDGSAEHDWSYAPTPATLVGSIGLLQHALCAEQLE